jgi:hypothetical protein
MTLLKGKHVVKEFDSIRCSVVEEGCSKERIAFLKDLLEHNGYEVRTEEVPPAEEGGVITWSIGVTSLLFNPVIAVYQRMLLTKDGRRITPDYWNQKTAEIEPNYWDLSKKHA